MDRSEDGPVEGLGEVVLQGIVREAQAHASLPDEAQQKKEPRRLRIPAEHLARVAVAQRRLASAYPDAGPDEKILHELAAEETALAAMLQDVERQLATRLLLTIHDPRAGVTLSRALKQVTESSSAVGRRIRDALQAAAALRAQRRLLNLGAHDV